MTQKTVPFISNPGLGGSITGSSAGDIVMSVPGGAGLVVNSTVGIPGYGGCNPFGGCSFGPASGNGGGGSGAYTSTTAHGGVPGNNGIVVIYEYT